MKTRLCGSGLGRIQNITGWCTGKKDDKEPIQLFKNREIMTPNNRVAADFLFVRVG
jgi:hypothetical protein